MSEDKSVWVSYGDGTDDYADQLINYLSQHSYTVAWRNHPRLLLAPAMQSCRYFVAVLTRTWEQSESAQRELQLFQAFSLADSTRQTVVWRSTLAIVPDNLLPYPLINAIFNFDGATRALEAVLSTPTQSSLRPLIAGTPVATPFPKLPSTQTPAHSPAPSIMPQVNLSMTVFISYAHPDREIEQRLIADLQAAGIKVWVDHERLSPGTPDWEREIREGISKSNGLIYIASEEATTSRYVRGELGVAEDEGVRVYPIWAKGEKWSRCVPLGFSIVQRADARGAKYESGVQALIASLKKASGYS